MIDGKYVAGTFDSSYSRTAYIHLGMDNIPGYIEEHEARIDEALEQNPDELVIEATLKPGKGGTD